MVSDKDQEVVDSIVQGDTIESIELHGDIETLLKEVKEVQFWNEVLDEA